MNTEECGQCANHHKRSRKLRLGNHNRTAQQRGPAPMSGNAKIMGLCGRKGHIATIMSL